MRVGSLFSGIGGLDLGLERAGMTVAWQSEIDPYACRVLARHWPTVPNHGDITTIDWSTVEPVDLICGGYPCQPFSSAGARAGENDVRHLWPYFADALRVLRPRWALLENVPGHLSLGFGQVLGDLAELGFDAEWECIPAAAVGAPHLRYRVFVVAHTNSEGESDDAVDAFSRPRVMVPDTGQVGWGANEPDVSWGQPDPVGCSPPELADADIAGPSRRAGATGRRPSSSRRVEPQRLGDGRTGDRATSRGHWASEPDVGRVAHGVPSRVDRLKCLGNAVVPQVAEWVGRRIVEAAA